MVSGESLYAGTTVVYYSISAAQYERSKLIQDKRLRCQVWKIVWDSVFIFTLRGEHDSLSNDLHIFSGIFGSFMSLCDCDCKWEHDYMYLYYYFCMLLMYCRESVKSYLKANISQYESGFLTCSSSTGCALCWSSWLQQCTDVSDELPLPVRSSVFLCLWVWYEVLKFLGVSECRLIVLRIEIVLYSLDLVNVLTWKLMNLKS